MASGKHHDRVNALATIAVAIPGVITLNPGIVSLAVGMAIGTLWLSPDLDLRQSNATNRLGVFKVLFVPYRAICGSHRSFISHSPLVSTAVRVIYCLGLLIIVLKLFGKLTLLSSFLLHPLFFWFYCGLEVSTDLHLFLDFAPKSLTFTK